MTVVARRLARSAASYRRSPARLPGPAVWSLDLTDPGWDLAAAAALLSGAEAERAVRGAPEVCRRRVLLRAGLRVVLGRLLGVDPARVPIGVDDGRPYLADAGAGGIELSCSASDGVGLIALAPGTPVGVDVQRHRDAEAREAAGEGWLAPVEQARLAGLAPRERWPAVTRCWTQKEAVLKGLGVGLRRPPATVVTPVARSGRSGEWSLAPVGVPAGLVASLAVRTAVAVPAVAVTQLTPGGVR
jgi:4'-phosphopantetheinyl transferase